MKVSAALVWKLRGPCKDYCLFTKIPIWGSMIKQGRLGGRIESNKD